MFIIGLLATLVMLIRGMKGAILIGIVGTTVLAIIVEAIAKVVPAGGPNPNPHGWSLNVPKLPAADPL